MVAIYKCVVYISVVQYSKPDQSSSRGVGEDFSCESWLIFQHFDKKQSFPQSSFRCLRYPQCLSLFLRKILT